MGREELSLSEVARVALAKEGLRERANGEAKQNGGDSAGGSGKENKSTSAGSKKKGCGGNQVFL
jgi:hypothetical protein